MSDNISISSVISGIHKMKIGGNCGVQLLVENEVFPASLKKIPKMFEFHDLYAFNLHIRINLELFSFLKGVYTV